MFSFDNCYITTDLGVIHGAQEENGVRVFKGIPFAKPPVGELRWRPPVEADAWHGVREALLYGGEAVQNDDVDPLNPEVPIALSSAHRSEDCLYLNIWTPAVSDTKRLPVFIYIHGGGYQSGAGSHSLYRGGHLAKRGIVVVTINYRLGILGFFAHPQLSEESPYGVSGNYGLLDQNMAIRWVKNNIAAFGGDPDSITIGGQSAGAGSVGNQLVMPLSAGLFQRAAIQSGPVFGDMMQPVTLEIAHKNGLEFAMACRAANIEVLRTLSPWKLLETCGHKYHFSPIVDGYYVPAMPSSLFLENKENDVDLLIGNTGEEFSTGSDVCGMEPHIFEKQMREKYDTYSDEILELYPHHTPVEAMRSMNQFKSDMVMYYGNVCHAKVSAPKHKVYMYHYEKDIPCEHSDIYGAPHSAELPYLFGMENTGGSFPWNPVVWGEKEYIMSEIMIDYWVSFISGRQPASEHGPVWECFDHNDQPVMILNEKPYMLPFSGVEKKMKLAEALAKNNYKIDLF